MTIIDRIASFAFRNINDSAEDEYQEKMLYQSLAVGFYTLPLTTLATAAAFAWVLPGRLSLLSFVVLLPYIAAEFFTKLWLHDRAPRFTVIRGWVYYAVTLSIIAVMVAGTSYRLSQIEGTTGFDIGYLLGGLVGAIAAIIFVPRKIRKQRAADKARLEANLED